MSAAAFVLAINLFIAAIFATAFGVVAAYNRSAVGARWLALAYGLGVVNPILEFILPGQVDPRPVQVAIFAVFLFAFSLSVVFRSLTIEMGAPCAIDNIRLMVSGGTLGY